ncbi:hypothetical protein EDB87DRAFT_1637438 [Lactarius vividus]|nr:hypothetical protein EDB87DRAFT_1637438 [Lactarius vividus]
MVEYVYARHDFVPEHDDEIPFRAGERIEVVEKDEQYEDGWWQGRNLAGKVGLFPESYTQPAPPTSSPPPGAISASFSPTAALPDNAPSPPPSLPIPEPESSQSLHEDSSPSITNGDAHPNHTTTKSNGEVMRATMTDVQKAIEQLGHKDDFDGSRSFTFSSTRGESTDHDTDTDADGEDWHKTARQKLAENAKMAAEEQAARESAEIRAPIRSTVPPIDVEMSDDSGDEDDAPPNGHLRRHSHIPEEDEEDTASPQPPVNGRRFSDSSSIQPSESYIVPSPAVRPESDFAEDTATEAGASTATQPSFPLPQIERNSFLPTPVSPDRRGISKGISTNGTDAASHPSSAQLLFPSKTQTLSLKEAAGVLPSPAASTTGHRHGYSFGSATSSTRATAASPLLLGIRTVDQRLRHVHPADWTVEEVIDWLRSKGFDEDSCKKFAEQEITGDVLLDLDVNVLKSEIGIMAYGKRMRIANAIAELRRPPSVMSSSADQHTRPGSYSQGSPFPLLGTAQNSSSLDTAGQNLVSPDSSPDSGLAAVTPDSVHQNSDPGVRTSLDQVNDSSATIGLGLGIPTSLIPGAGQGKSVKARPTQLSLSPSDGALGANAKAVAVEQEEEERVVLSDSDTKNFTSKSRGQLFGRQNSTSSTGKLSSSRISKEVTTPRSDTSQLSEGSRPRHERRKRSLDANRENSRLSIFGSTFAGTLGKSRKPPPRYSSAVDEASSDRNPLSLSRLYHSGSHRKSSTRSSPADSHMALVAKEEKNGNDSSGSKDKKDPSLLRKRTPSATDTPLRTSTESSTLKPGQNILAQIGTPDHNGWMRKKGEHYNTWKNRYFVLKGPHLYWLKSNAQSETKIKGYVNIVGYRIISDENVDPGRYGFKLLHETDRTHCFSSDEQVVIREWMKALMKATIDRDYTKPVVSSVNVPTIPLAVAQAMNPAPRPPSPTARAATQRAMRRENTNQLSTRDAEILMGMPAASPPQSANGRPRVESFFNELEAVGPSSQSTSPKMQDPPVRPPRELRKKGSMSEHSSLDPDLIEWANNHLPSTLQLDSRGSICGGLELLRIAESIKGLRSSSVPDSAFPRGRGNDDDDKLEGLFTLFDFLLDNDVKMGTVSINDVRQGKRDKINQLLKALRAWDDKRKMILQSIGEGSMQAGPFVVPI